MMTQFIMNQLRGKQHHQLKIPGSRKCLSSKMRRSSIQSTVAGLDLLAAGPSSWENQRLPLTNSRNYLPSLSKCFVTFYIFVFRTRGRRPGPVVAVHQAKPAQSIDDPDTHFIDGLRAYQPNKVLPHSEFPLTVFKTFKLVESLWGSKVYQTSSF